MVKQNVGGEPIQRIHRPIKSQKTSVAIREKVASNRLSYQRHTTHHNYHTSPPQNVKVYNQKSNIRCQATLELRKKYFLYYLQIVKTFTKNITLSPLIYIPYTYNKCQDILLPFKLNHEKYTTIQRLLYNNYNQSKYFDIYLQTQPTPTFKFSRQREVSKNYSPDKPRKKLTLPSNPR